MRVCGKVKFYTFSHFVITLTRTCSIKVHIKVDLTKRIHVKGWKAIHLTQTR